MTADNLEHFVQWDFPGGVVGLLLFVFALVALVLLSYRFTLRALPPKQKAILIALRIASLAIIVFCLCNPKTVSVKKISSGGDKTVAVVIDTSSSMRKKTFSGSTRVKNAVAYWKKHAAEVAPGVKCEFYAFDDTLRKTKALDTIPATNWKPLKKTHLFNTIEKTCEKYQTKQIDGAIFITDGVDTSGAPSSIASTMLKSSMMPCAFVPATDPVPHKPFAKLARIECASAASANSSVPVSILTAYSGLPQGSTVSIDVIQNGRKKIFHHSMKAASPAPNSKDIPLSLELATPGEYAYEAILKVDGDIQSKAFWTVTCLEKHPAKVLLYMGGLDWGARFMKTVAALDKEDFELDVKFAPGILNNSIATENIDATFPSETDLERYSIVIILKMEKGQISNEIESRLHDYVSNGGALLFIIANSASAAHYANSPLEKLLPVFFEKDIHDQSKFDRKTADFLKKMEEYRKKTKARGMAAWSKYNPNVDYSMKEPPLTTMALTREGKESPVFSYLQATHANWKKISIPAFQDCALITDAKPGAEVLAVHPEFKTKQGKRILLAVQRYGSGRTAVLATDPLWRWKLSLDSRDPSYELFWKHIIGWLSSGLKNEPAWRLPSMILETGTVANIFFDVPAAAKFDDVKIQFHAVDLESKRKIQMHPCESSPHQYRFKFTPPRTSRFRLIASAQGKTVAATTFSSTGELASSELELLTPDTKTLKRLAAASPAGNFISMSNNLSRLKWLKPNTDEPKIEVRTESPLWHQSWLFVLLLLLFATDLCIRRKFRLV